MNKDLDSQEHTQACLLANLVDQERLLEGDVQAAKQMLANVETLEIS